MDKLRLEYEIKRNGLTINDFCQEMGMSRSAFYRKCNGISDFTHAEIVKTLKILNLTTPMGIFFSQEVSEKTQ